MRMGFQNGEAQAISCVKTITIGAAAQQKVQDALCSAPGCEGWLLGGLGAGLPASVIKALTCPWPGVSISSAKHDAGSSPKTSGSPRTRLFQRPKRTPRPLPGVPFVLRAPAAALGNMAPP